MSLIIFGKWLYYMSLIIKFICKIYDQIVNSIQLIQNSACTC